MNKTNLILVLLFIFAAFVCMSGVASAAPVSIDAIYVGNTMVDLNWSKYPSTDFSKYELYRNESLIQTTTNRSLTFYRDDSGLPKGDTYGYEIRVYNSSYKIVENATTSAKTGDVHGTITIDTNWAAASSPYNLTDTVTVEKGATLTIEPEVTVNYAKLYLHGVIYVDGVSFIGEGLSIHNSTGSTIKNCKFDGNGTAGPGIYLESCNDSTITGNTIVNYSSHGGKGVYLNSSSNNMISSNNISNNRGEGIYLYNSSDNNITNNTASNNGWGIYLYDNSSNNMISSNNVSNNCWGILVEYFCNNSIITGNTANSNNGKGIYSFYSSNNTISSNNVLDNRDDGIWVGSLEDSTITNNNASNNGFVGIYLRDSHSSTLTSNTADSNYYAGIWLDYSDSSTLTGNTMSGNKCNFGVYGGSLSDYILNIDTSNLVDGKPIYYWVDRHGGTIPDDAGFVGIVNSRDITVKDLTLTNNGQGVILAYTNNSRIENVNASNNCENGIYLLHSHSNNLTNNSAPENDYGIRMYSSSNNNIANNTANLNSRSGIYLDSSSNNNITNNTANYNNRKGIYLGDFSNNNIISNNNVSYNTDGIRIEDSTHNKIENNNVSYNFGCFLEGTKILLADSSYKNIEDVEVGDLVQSYDEENKKEMVTGKVLKTFYHEKTDYYLVINGKLRLTPNHPMYVNNEWKEAGGIKIGDLLLDKDGNYISVTSIEKIDESVPVYNLEVSGYHNYFADDILTHNKCPRIFSYNGTGYQFDVMINVLAVGQEEDRLFEYPLKYLKEPRIRVEYDPREINYIDFIKLIIEDVTEQEGLQNKTYLLDSISCSGIDFDCNLSLLEERDGQYLISDVDHKEFFMEFEDFSELESGYNRTIKIFSSGYQIILDDANFCCECEQVEGVCEFLDEYFSENNNFGGESGIHLGNANYTTIASNSVTDNDVGIYLYSSFFNNITNNTASNNWVGISIESSSDNNITSNNASNSYDGVRLYYSNNNTIANNTASNNDDDGICLDSSSDNIIMNNTVNANIEIGIVLESSSNNLIYNNFFNNTNNANDDGNNIWNITKTNGTNIVGGPYLGGNYWSDYAGNDTDGDCLGDTLLPYNSSGNITHGGDYHPLTPGIDISVSDIVAKVLVDGENATINATVHTNASFNVSNVTVQLLVNNESIHQNKTVEIPKNSSTNVTFDGWNVSWSVKESKQQPINITVVIDPDNEICDANRTNNTVTRYFPLAKGERKADADGRGFLISDYLISPYATSIAIWFDDDAHTSKKGMPTRHYNPIATDIAVLNDIETEFKGTQYPNGIFNLNANSFELDAEKTFTTFWKPTPGMGIVIAEYPVKAGRVDAQAALVSTPIASYLNWPMAPPGLIKNHGAVAKSLIDELNITYVLVIAGNKNEVKSIITDLKNLDLKDNQTIFVKGFAVEPLDNLEPTDLFKEVLDAFGDKSSGIVVTNSLTTSTSIASAPLAAFYKSMILDVRDVMAVPVSYAPDSYSGLKHINLKVRDILDKPGAGKHDMYGFIAEYMKYKGSVRDFYLHLVGSASYLPFYIAKEPPGLNATDSDRDWIATDGHYYKFTPCIIYGGRMPLVAWDNVNYMARALQFAELDVGKRGEWEDDFLASGIYNTKGARNWTNNRVWWLESVVYAGDKLHKDKGGKLTQLYEQPSAHQGGRNSTWVAFNRQKQKWTWEGPRNYVAAPPLPAGQALGTNDDHDYIATEPGTGYAEIIRDVNNDGHFTIPPDQIVYAGRNPGIQAPFGNFRHRVDEEMLDGTDNDGDGAIDEDCGHWIFGEVDEIYNERFKDPNPDPTTPDVDNYIDLIDKNLINNLNGKGIIFYSGHSGERTWNLRNLHGWSHKKNATTGKFIKDNRSRNNVTLDRGEVPKISPSFVIAASCGSSRIWKTSITETFLEKGALCYLGATAIAYAGPSDELLKQVLDQISKNNAIGEAYIIAIDNLDRNDLWAKKFNTSQASVKKTKYEFNLFGLSSVKIDPPISEDEKVSYDTPVYNPDTKKWEVNITFDIPEPVEVCDSNGSVIEIYFTDVNKLMFDEDDYPALSLIYFDYDLPIGGNISNVSFANATVYKVYNISQPNVRPKSMWEEEVNLSDIMENETGAPPGNETYNFTLNTTAVYDEGFEKVNLYTGELFPDVLFVNGSEHDPLANRDRVFGSVTAWQVNGTNNKTIVYDKIVLKLTYTAPVGIEETHVVDGKDLTVYATIVSTDEKMHLVKPSLVIETVGGIIYREITAENITVSETPQNVTFEVSDIELPKYVGWVIVTEEGKCVAETSFTVTPPKIVINEVYPYPNVMQDAKEEWIEIYNAGELEVNLTGWWIVDGDSDLNYTIPANDSDWDGILESCSYLVFHIGGTLDTPAEDIYGNFTSGVLNDTNESISLLSANSTGKDIVRYGNCTDEPPAGTFWTGVNPDAPVQGQSLGRDKDSTDTNDGNDWENTGGIDVDGPTAGLRNFREVQPPNITSYAPESPVQDTVCNWRTFNITVNQTVNVSWYLNDSLQFKNESVTEANCTLHVEVASEHNVSAIATNANGTDMQTWIWNVTAAPPAPPNISFFAPPSHVSDTICNWRMFNVTVNQTVNVSWYLNDSLLFTNESVTEANYTLHAEVAGEHNVSAVTTNPNGTDMQMWIWNVTVAPAPAPPNITSFAPPSPVNDVEGATRIFNIKIDQPVNISWQINGTEVQTNTSVTEASYTNTSAAIGTWNVSAIATNANGTDMQTWIWTVEASSPCYIATATYGTPLDENIDVLRDFRDEVLMMNPIGEAFVSTYYATSPPIADALRENEGLRTITRLTLITPLVYLSKFALNGILVVFIVGLTVVPLYLRRDRKKILKSLLVGMGSILVLIAAIFSLGFAGYAIPFCAVVGAYMLPFVIPLSVVFTLCTVLNLNIVCHHKLTRIYCAKKSV